MTTTQQVNVLSTVPEYNNANTGNSIYGQLSTASPEITTRDETVFVLLKMKPLGLVQLILGDAQAEGNMNEMTLKRCRGG